MKTLHLPSLLIVDDDPLIRDSLSLALSGEFDILLAEDRAQAIRLVRDLAAPPELALVDLGLPPTPHRPQEGFRLITELLAHSPQIKIITLSGQSEEGNARHARALGAFEFVAKPCRPETLRDQLRAAWIARRGEQRAAVQNARRLGLVGESPAVEAMRSQIKLYANTPYPVLIQGESGSGKELVAAALHQLGTNPAAPLVAINCAAIAANLLESTLFGHAKGAFTGATAAQEGFFEKARDGTLFLDEIGELPLELQAKLLRVLENGEYQRVGETATRRSNARIVAATNRVLAQAVRDGSFRADLFHRLSVFTINVPPLRELGADKLRLLEHFCAEYAAQLQVPCFTLDEAAQEAWLRYPFPGNTRELRNIVIRLMTRYPGATLSATRLEAEFDPQPALPDGAPLAEDAQSRLLQGEFNLDDLLMGYTRTYVDTAMELARGNVSEAAKMLGIARTTLYSRMEALQKHGTQQRNQ
ncbi:MAG: sigma-54-dependent Fis family transcriptional regulator [Gallionella sp.]|nr:sigma-54-dependent Fis family transcriptional regulator [Gallionella sp.]OIO13018.1 MAG: sigma-54-dependent Fis family transcriptional regulator [Gallionellaceae bacterium CG1_02_60_325]PIR09020.1 MAG: sigma-54-dependent Fis family transcriptional regulator [Gallionellaceae bacterium CG11_big_fil_rev_8_21_14_0_20_60_62]PJC04211.1 MAG: sigma-54-dependent Fis family transcriptional regulator [Gallionellaceae bacterium CG_4_9_14_0_8_um_filter_60_335]